MSEADLDAWARDQGYRLVMAGARRRWYAMDEAQLALADDEGPVRQLASPPSVVSLDKCLNP